MENSARIDLIQHLIDYQDELSAKLRDENTNYTLLEQEVCGVFKIYQCEEKWLDVFNNQIKVYPKSLSLPIYKDALRSFLSDLIQQLNKADDSGFVAQGIVLDQAHLQELLRLLAEHKQKTAEVETAQRQWQARWQKVFDDQVKMQRLRVLGILANAPEVADQPQLFKDNLVDFAVATATEVQLDKLTLFSQRKSSSEITQNIIARLKLRDIDLGLPETIPDSIVGLVDLIRAHEQTIKPLDRTSPLDQEIINKISGPYVKKLESVGLNSEETTIANFFADKATYVQVATVNSLAALASENSNFQQISDLVGKNVGELEKVSSVSGLANQSPALWLFVNEGLLFQIQKSIGGNLEGFKQDSLQRLQAFFQKRDVPIPTDILNQLYDQVIAAPNILPSQTKGPPPPTTPTGTTPLITTQKAAIAVSDQTRRFLNRFPLSLYLRQGLSPLFSAFGSIFGKIFSGMFSFFGFGNQGISQLPTNVLSVPSTAGSALSNLQTTGRAITTAVKTGTKLFSSPTNVFLAVAIAVFLSLVIDIAPLGASPATTVIPIALTPAGGKGPAEYYEEIYYEGDAPPAEIAGCPVNEGCVFQGPGGTGSHENLDAYDFAGNDETLVYVTHDGYVVTYYNGMARNTHPEGGGFGNYVRLVGETASGEKFYTTYAHFWRVSKQVIDAYDCLQRQDYSCALIKAGDVLGQVDDTGYSSGPHLHYQYNGPGRLVIPNGCGGWPKMC